MKKLMLLSLLSVSSICYAQDSPIKINKNIIDKPTFEALKKYSVLSTEVIDNPNNNGEMLLQFRILDLNDKKSKYYNAELDASGYISLSKTSCFPTALRYFSIMTVPFKVRARNKDGQVTAKADIKNIGLYVPFYVKDIKRYWLDNSTSSHKFSIGALIAPMSEDLSDKNTGNYFNDPNKSYSAFMLSASAAATYSYKSITFAVIPVGFDFGLDRAGKKWINNGKYWFGFGIGVDTKLFGF